jgi:hypothetical protein
MKRLYVFFVALLLAGCATLNSVTSTTTVLINTAVTLAAEVYISKAGGTATPPLTFSPLQQQRAQRLYNAAFEISGFASGTVTVAEINAKLLSWIASLKTPLEQAEATLLVEVIDTILSARISSGVLSAAATVLVSDLMTDLETAALQYGAVAPAGAKKHWW